MAGGDDARRPARARGRRAGLARGGPAPAVQPGQLLRGPHDTSVEAPTNSALERALAVLEAIVASPRALNLQEVADRVDLPRQSAHRILAQLLAGGMLQRHVDHDRFALGPRLRRLAREALYRSHLDGPAHAVLEELAAVTEETCSLGVLDHDSVLLIDRVESHWSLRVHSQVGRRLQPHSSSIGKLLLAHLPKARRHRLLTARPLQRYTVHTLVTETALEADFAEIRRRGYALSNQGTTLGLYSIAAPLRDPQQRVIAGLAIQVPTARIDIERAERDLLPLLLGAAARLDALIAADWIDV